MLALLLLALPQTLPTAEEARAGLARGVAWLVHHQNEDGSWGHWRNPESGFWSNLETHRSWQVATTGLACVALMDAEVTANRELAALRRGISFLTEHADVKRPSDWDVDNTWAYVYGLAALVRAAEHPEFVLAQDQRAIRAMGERLLAALWRYQSPLGGWAYYADETKARRPWWATSFQTAVAILGILEAQRLGWPVDEERLERAVAALARCRLPNGAYTYSIRAIPSPGSPENINQVKGSLSRIQVCNLALHHAARAGYGEGVAEDDLRRGIQQFFKEHRFLDVARGKPVPHEAFYYNSGYFYFFGHLYAALVLELLPEADRRRYRPRLWREILKTQAADGSMWDYYMNDYGKPYGVSFGVSTLARSQPPESAGPG